MAFYEDMSAYSRRDNKERSGLVNIGWLEGGCKFATEKPESRFLDALWRYCKIATAGTRGIHRCTLCPITQKTTPLVEYNGKKLIFGSAEIRVFGKNGTVYASPNLVFHYVKDHYYCPPEEFIKAVLDLPDPFSEQYFVQLEDSETNWRVLSFWQQD